MENTPGWIYLLVILFMLSASGCIRNQRVVVDDESTTASRGTVYGRIVSVSNTTGTIQIEEMTDGAPETIELSYDRKARGMDHVSKGNRVVVSYRVAAGRKVVTSVKSDETGLAAGVSEISVAQVNTLMKNRDRFVLIDARPSVDYAASHLPTAVSIPSCTIKQQLHLLPEDKDTLLVFYCGGTSCGMSGQASAFAAKAGYTRVRVMLEGIKGWSGEEYMTVADDAFILNDKPVLIDLRPAHKDTVHRIPGSVSIPLPTLADRLGDIPGQAPVVVYSDRIQESLKGLNSLRATGLQQVAMVDGNFQGWQERRGPIVSGPVENMIHWRRKPGKDEVSTALLTRLVNDGSAGAVILDVRTREEAVDGMLMGAIHIPLNELYDRLQELPRDRKIYLYSATGARADMACRHLLANGFDAAYLAAEVNCHNGICIIEQQVTGDPGQE